MILLTIDTDWAPEEATRVVLEKVRALRIKTTVFFSAPSPLPFWPELEVGCHPDLSRRFAGQAEGGDLDQAGAGHDAAALAAEGDILKSYRRALRREFGPVVPACLSGSCSGDVSLPTQ